MLTPCSMTGCYTKLFVTKISKAMWIQLVFVLPTKSGHCPSPDTDLIVPFCCPFPDAQPSAPRDHPQRDMGTSLAPHGRALQGPSGESQGGAAHRFCSRQLLWGTAEFVSSAATGESLWVGDRLKFLMQLFFFPDKYFWAFSVRS